MSQNYKKIKKIESKYLHISEYFLLRDACSNILFYQL